MALYDLLGINEDEGIDPTEVEAIKSTLDRIKVVAAGVAKTNDTSGTLSILREIEKVVRKAVDGGVSSVDDFHQYLTQNRSGRPAAALGGGATPSTPSNAREGLQAILGDSSVDQGIKEALRRLLTPSDPEHIPVGRDGTPAELAATRHERDAIKAERDKAKQDLANQSDVSRMGSLAHQLAEMRAERDRLRNNAGTGSASAFDKAAAKAARDEVYDAIDGLTAKFGGLKGKDKLELKFGNLLSAVGLPKHS